jgi:hypothetical protein
MAGKISQTYTVAQLTDATFAQDPSVQAQLRQLALSCR